MFTAHNEKWCIHSLIGEKPIFTVLCVHTVMEVCAGSGIAAADQGESSS